jgi:hypothetical protein
MQFTGSHMCHLAEYSRAAATQTPPSGGAWVDLSGYLRGGSMLSYSVASSHMGRYVSSIDSGNCDNWTAGAVGTVQTSGTVVTATGTSSAICTTAHAIACCE